MSNSLVGEGRSNKHAEYTERIFQAVQRAANVSMQSDALFAYSVCSSGGGVNFVIRDLLAKSPGAVHAVTRETKIFPVLEGGGPIPPSKPDQISAMKNRDPITSR
jgi:hypothetical protein